MVIEVELPNGDIAEFPDDMSQEQIIGVLQKQFPKKKLYEQAWDAYKDFGRAGGDVLRDVGRGAIEGVVGRGVGIIQSASQLARAGANELGYEQTPFLDDWIDSTENVASDLQRIGKGTGIAGLAGQMIADPLNLATAGVPITKGANIINRVAKNAVVGGGLGALEGAISALTDSSKRGEAIQTSATLGAVVPTAIEIARLEPVSWVARQAKDALTPVSDTVVRNNAGKRLAEVSADIADKIANRERGTFIKPTLTQSVDDAGIAGLQEVAEKNSGFRQALTEREATNQELLQRAQEVSIGAGDIRQTQDFAQRATNMLQGRTQRLAQSATDATSALNPSVSIADAGSAARTKIEANKTAFMQNVERPAWDAVPKEVPVNANATLNTLKNLQDRMGVAKQNLIPTDKVMQVLSLGKEQRVPSSVLDANGNPFIVTQKRGNLTLGEMQDLRSVLMEDASRARAAGENVKASIHEKLADSVLDDMGARAGSVQGEAGALLRNALDKTKYRKQTFGSGEIGDVLGSERDRVASVADELTLENLLGAGRVKGSVGLDRLLKAAPEAKVDAEQYLLNRFKAQAIKVNDGSLNTDQASRFLRDNQDIFRTMPETKKKIQNAISAAKRYNLSADRQYALYDALNIKETQRVFGVNKVELASDFLQGDANVAMNTLLKNKSPNAVRDVIRYAKKDPTGGAVIGLRAAAANYVFSAKTGAGMRKIISDPKQRVLLQEILPPAHLQRMERIVRDFEIIERGTKAADIGDVLTRPNNALQAIARVAVLKAAGAANVFSGGGSMAQASILSSNIRKIINRLTTKKTDDVLMEAIMNPDLAQALTMHINTPESQKKFMGLIQKIGTTNAGRLLLQDSGDENNADYAPANNGDETEIIITPQSNYFEMPAGSDFTRTNEGSRSTVYNDTTGNPTVGIGFNFNSGIAPKVWRKAGMSPQLYNQVKRGEATITPEQQEALYRVSFDIADKDARSYYADFDNLSEQQQTALRDMSYQMGASSLNEFKGLRKGLQNKDDNAIVKSIIRSKYYKQTPERAIANAKLLMNGVK